MEKSANEQLIRAFYKDRMTNDPDAPSRFFAEDGAFEMMGEQPNGSGSVAVSGARDGSVALRDGLRGVVEAWNWREQTIHKLLVDGDQAAVFYELVVHHAPSGEIFSTHLCDLIDLKDGKIARMIEFVDTQKVANLGK